MNIDTTAVTAAVIDLNPDKSRESIDAHRDELTVYANAQRRTWNLAAQRDEREARDAMVAKAARLGCSLALLDYIEGLEARLERFEAAEREEADRAYHEDQRADLKLRRGY